MGTLSIKSGVYVDTATGTTSRFTTVALAATSDVKTSLYPGEIAGMRGLEQPIAFSTERFTRKKAIDDLLSIATTFIARPPRRTLDGFIDAVVNDGAELCEFEWTERDRRDGTTYTQSTFGFFQIGNPTVRGTRESLQLVLYPVNRLRFVNSATFLSDADYN